MLGAKVQHDGATSAVDGTGRRRTGDRYWLAFFVFMLRVYVLISPCCLDQLEQLSHVVIKVFNPLIDVLHLFFVPLLAIAFQNGLFDLFFH